MSVERQAEREIEMVESDLADGSIDVREHNRRIGEIGREMREECREEEEEC